jgi:N-methylhydantoinase A/acetone carboxylase, beta subunit
MTNKHYLGVDTGGTFTDFYWHSPAGSRIHKVLSTPDAPERAILQGIAELGLTETMKAGDLVIVHGSTVATNAALEGKGARTVFVTNKGFKDLLLLGRQNREAIYALHPEPVTMPLPEELCLEVDCRRDASGEVVTPLTDTAIAELREQIQDLRPESVAINLLYSFLDTSDEKRLLTAVPQGVLACCSADVLPEYREYERGVATWLNAWLGPKVARYLDCLEQQVSPSQLAVMQSSGGTIAAEQAAKRSVNLLLSGPAGGLAAAQHIGEQIGVTRLLTFDMGGTSTDVALIDGKVRLTTEGRLAHYPVAVPMVDMHTIGAGGGSIAYLDQAGLLHVGPESAGASPGPACYGLGGQLPTVTDANAVLGRLRPDYFLGGRMTLDLVAAQNAVGRLAEKMKMDMVTAALGIIALANEHMARALRVISVQRGHNPRLFELCCFGGAGGLHVCALAEELGINRILIPANGGVLSAYGMLVAQPQRQLSSTLLLPWAEVDAEQLDKHIGELSCRGEAELLGEGVTGSLGRDASLDCRYAGQSFTLNIPWSGDMNVLADEFHAAHKARYGHSLSLPLEIVNVRVQVQAPKPLQDSGLLDLPVVQGSARECIDLPELGNTEVWLRSELACGQCIQGPAIICEQVATTLLTKNWTGYLDDWGNMRLTHMGGT